MKRQDQKKYFFLMSFTTLFLCTPFTSQASNIPENILLRSDDFSEPIQGETLESFMDTSLSMRLNKHYRSEIENANFCPTTKLFCSLFLSEKKRSGLEFSIGKNTNPQAIETYLTNLSSRFNSLPKNTKLGIEDNKVVIKEKSIPGKNLAIPKNAQKIASAIDQSFGKKSIVIELETEAIDPEFSITDPASLGLNEIIGEGTTNFRGSPKNRIYNINRSLEQFQGLLIAPNEEFSFVTALGEVDGEHGYLPELVIKNNKTEPEFGGGVCQVSSTVFRAAIYSGLKITERRNHAYPVQYYKPYGMDATIYIPKPDLRFKNNTGKHILIQPTIEGTKLTFQFFGTNDDRSVLVDGPHILESNPDGSMKTVFTQTVTSTSGEKIINDTFWSNYKSPSLFPHPGEKIITEKPKDWSAKQWQNYKKIRP